MRRTLPRHSKVERWLLVPLSRQSTALAGTDCVPSGKKTRSQLQGACRPVSGMWGQELGIRGRGHSSQRDDEASNGRGTLGDC